MLLAWRIARNQILSPKNPEELEIQTREAIEPLLLSIDVVRLDFAALALQISWLSDQEDADGSCAQLFQTELRSPEFSIINIQNFVFEHQNRPQNA